MKVLYISSLCCPQRARQMESYFKEKLLSAQVQIFNGFMIKGLIGNKCDLEHLTTCSQLSRFANKRYLKGDFHNYFGINYYSLPVLFIPVAQFIFAIFSTFFFTLRWAIKNRKDELVIICDVMEFFNSVGAWITSKIMRINIIAVVTDLPQNAVGLGGQGNFVKKSIINLYKNFTNKFVNKFDMYVLLTMQMNDIINKKNKPFIIIEGIVDEGIRNKSNLLENKYEKKVILYAGFLEKRHGLNMLIEAFTKTSNPDYEIHIYGKGNSEDYIKNSSRSDNRIKLLGLVPNSVVLEAEIKSTLLVNPRPTNQEFTKYSFPSKNMEYMASGTPVLTTKLPGMPREYNEFVYIIEDETIYGLTEDINRILSKPSEELHQFGFEAKQFVLHNKNYNIQGKKLVDLIRKNMRSNR